MTVQPKRKFHKSHSRSEKVKIVTVLPQSLDVQRTAREFQTSNWMTRIAKTLVKVHGILSSPNPQPSKTRLSKSIEDLYECDDTHQSEGKFKSGCPNLKLVSHIL
jgi:hypothetical protein